jgi:ubiquitin carboxyl-terminal hydrolase 9/24
MNSFMQQLYMVPSFREGLLAVGDYTSKASEDSILHQMQVMFGYLKISQKKFFDTISFCRAVRDPSGQVVNLGYTLSLTISLW